LLLGGPEDVVVNLGGGESRAALRLLDRSRLLRQGLRARSLRVALLLASAAGSFAHVANSTSGCCVSRYSDAASQRWKINSAATRYTTPAGIHITSPASC